MYKKGVINLVPIFHVIIPVILGLLIAFIDKKFILNKKIKPIGVCFAVSIIYHLVLAINTSSKSEIYLIGVLFVWNSTLIIIGYKLFIYFFKNSLISSILSLFEEFFGGKK
ncbi:hypothetical protein [Clostridium isatidis]|uniref:Uncharacterized protein n=1 Tax=Clostridium isatidis TaxID=182773 RepID=A0A343JB51_9CLOT|nr:hypothetical protein [Clostridium isatidis]ASW42759.1 hypothetical protein BEN51_04495 [Clostridium isatidis]